MRLVEAAESTPGAANEIKIADARPSPSLNVAAAPQAPGDRVKVRVRVRRKPRLDKQEDGAVEQSSAVETLAAVAASAKEPMSGEALEALLEDIYRDLPTKSAPPPSRAVAAGGRGGGGGERGGGRGGEGGGQRRPRSKPPPPADAEAADTFSGQRRGPAGSSNITTTTVVARPPAARSPPRSPQPEPYVWGRTLTEQEEIRRQKRLRVRARQEQRKMAEAAAAIGEDRRRLERGQAGADQVSSSNDQQVEMTQIV